MRALRCVADWQRVFTYGNPVPSVGETRNTAAGLVPPSIIHQLIDGEFQFVQWNILIRPRGVLYAATYTILAFLNHVAFTDDET